MCFNHRELKGFFDSSHIKPTRWIQGHTPFSDGTGTGYLCIMRSRRRFYCSITSTSTLSTGCLQYIKWESTLKLATASLSLSLSLSISVSVFCLAQLGSTRLTFNNSAPRDRQRMVTYTQQQSEWQTITIGIYSRQSNCIAHRLSVPFGTISRHLCAARHRNSELESESESEVVLPLEFSAQALPLIMGRFPIVQMSWKNNFCQA